MKNSSITFRTTEINKNKIKTIANKYNISISSLLNIIISDIAIEPLDFSVPNLKDNLDKEEKANKILKQIQKKEETNKYNDPYL